MENNNSIKENVVKVTHGRTDDVKNKKNLGGVETASGDSDVKTMFMGFAMLLWVGAFLCFLAYGIQSYEGDTSPDYLYIGGALTFVVIVSGLFTYYQENKSSKVMESFAKMIPPKAGVLRDGKVMEVDAVDLVLGDIVDIHGGDKTPEDIRIFESHGLKVDNSSLTGESIAIATRPETQDPNHMPLNEIFDNPLIADAVFKYLPLPDVKTAALVCK